ncbi:unnamed protein product, partial [Polarella glacialis]
MPQSFAPEPQSSQLVTAGGLREAKRRRLHVDHTVPSRRNRYRATLQRAVEAAAQGASPADVGRAAVEAVAVKAEELQRQELAFDEGLAPALEFMTVMGTLPGAVFSQLLSQLWRRLDEALRRGAPEAVKTVLSEMQHHVASSK